MNDRIVAAKIAYFDAFKKDPPVPYGVNEGTLLRTLEQAVADNKPIPDDYPWWGHLPQGAVA